MKLSVIGTGYVGLVTGTCFAEMGNHVECIDIDATKVEKMREGICPIYEPGLEPMMRRNIEANRLTFSTSYESIKNSVAVFMAVGTPSCDDGSADLKYMYAALDSLVPLIHDDLIVILKSTVPVGTGAAVKEYLAGKTDKKFHIVNNPEFLKEGAAVNDFMKPERVVVGTDNDYAWDIMDKLYDPFFRLSKRTIRMSNLSAEMTKYAANCFLATKISFMNEISRLCDKTGADVEEVRHGISTDSRIGTQFLYPGPGYGGSCFPKDVKALLYTAKQNDMNLQIIESAETVNHDQKTYMFEKMKAHFNGDLKGKKIALWGVAFKANTDDIRETPAIYMVKALSDAGAEVVFYDPVADDNFEILAKEQKFNAVKNESKYGTLEDADALLVLTEWKEFRMPDFIEIKNRLKSPVIFDGRNLYKTKYMREFEFTYYAIGKKI
jgi:UDPglucose 6-dehydrogenase